MRVIRRKLNILNSETKKLLDSSFKKFYEKVNCSYPDNLEKILLDITNVMETVESYGDSTEIGVNKYGKILARGSHQLSPEQAETYNFEPKDVFHKPYKERDICLSFIRDNVRRFGNTKTPIEFMLASYNWGPENVAKIIDLKKIDDFWELVHKYPNAFDDETVKHIMKIGALIQNGYAKELTAKRIASK